jgi:hypothetical protein
MVSAMSYSVKIDTHCVFIKPQSTALCLGTQGNHILASVLVQLSFVWTVINAIGMEMDKPPKPVHLTLMTLYICHSDLNRNIPDGAASMWGSTS